MAPPATHDFVLYLGVEDNVVPVGMEPNLVLIDNPERELLGDNFIMLSLSAPGDESLAPKGKRLIAARIKVNPKGGRLESAEAQKLSAGIHAKLRDLMPFLDDFTDFVATKESFELYGRERDEGWMQAIDDDRLGVALLACKTPHKQVYYAGRAVLPALGMEGEAISARTAANLLSEKLSKK
ncbi:MAG: hypothetical protein M5R36_14575 [Deltaproteobacteria bacterium]|nr:hypothetical protein [Deltaproteobacteria bacterium]